MQITKTKDEKKPNMDCVNLLTSVLIYYPEISKISIEPDEKIYINYIIQKILTDEEIEKTRTLLEECLKSYHYLEKTQVECNEVKINIEEKATFITIKRDMKTFSHGELRLINTLINEEFGELLIMDTDKIPMIDSTMLAQMDLIDTMFASLKINPVVEKMIGIREAGRVIVFNK
ncbi:hypothetical protein DWZ11_06295 [Megamonas rupellensis]|uniref:Uncharacterized protein n=1 Tax=Megamonas rupellensis TaxID=491921 RepID=A0A411ZRU7_9FIRM|nr:hypothetical protein [Megamonas rupellensis]RGQ05505.1 hypothetical protein DWZ11_06295 [Megamonas rupellensis]